MSEIQAVDGHKMPKKIDPKNVAVSIDDLGRIFLVFKNDEDVVVGCREAANEVFHAVFLALSNTPDQKIEIDIDGSTYILKLDKQIEEVVDLNKIVLRSNGTWGYVK